MNGEWGSNTTNYDYGFRIYNPSIGKFLSVDPLTATYPMLTPYQFASNTPIWAIDLDGLEAVTVNNFAFAPFDDFGGGFYGDGYERKFGDNVRPGVKLKENYRIGATVKIDLCTSEKLSSEAHGAYSQWLNTVPDFSDAEFTSIYVGQGRVDFHYAGNNEEFIIPFMTGDIDVHVNIGFEDIGNNTFQVTGRVYGDRYPSNETYLTDESGQKIFLGVSGVDMNLEGLGPIIELPFSGNEKMQKFSFQIKFDDNDNFESVILNNGTSYKIGEWNLIFETLNPSSTSTGTKVGNDKIQTNYNNDTDE